MNKIKLVQYGCGKMSIYTMKYAIEQGMEIVGALDINPSVIGKDIGEIMNSDKTGITVASVNDAETVLKETNPDICIITTMSLMKDVKDALLTCAKLGINAITTCEEAFYPFNSSPTLIDVLLEFESTIATYFLLSLSLSTARTLLIESGYFLLVSSPVTLKLKENV